MNNSYLYSTGSIRTLMRYGIYITNNAKKMHGETMARKIAGRKRLRKPQNQHKSKRS